MAVRICDYCVGIKNAIVVVVPIFLKHDSLCGQAISSSRLSSQSILHMHFHAPYVHVRIRACDL